MRKVVWVGTSRDELKAFPEDVRHVMGFALYQAQHGEKHVKAKPLRGFGGASVMEIVEEHRGDAFRGIYTVQFKDVIYVLHAFQKKSKKGAKTPKTQIELVRSRLARARAHFDAPSRHREK